MTDEQRLEMLNKQRECITELINNTQSHIEFLNTCLDQVNHQINYFKWLTTD